MNPNTDTTPQVWGNASGGYADELRLMSSPATDGANGTYINLRAHGGSLDFENTRVRRPNQHTNNTAPKSRKGSVHRQTYKCTVVKRWLVFAMEATFYPM